MRSVLDRRPSRRGFLHHFRPATKHPIMIPSHFSLKPRVQFIKGYWVTILDLLFFHTIFKSLSPNAVGAHTYRIAPTFWGANCLELEYDRFRSGKKNVKAQGLTQSVDFVTGRHFCTHGHQDARIQHSHPPLAKTTPPP